MDCWLFQVSCIPWFCCQVPYKRPTTSSNCLRDAKGICISVSLGKLFCLFTSWAMWSLAYTNFSSIYIEKHKFIEKSKAGASVMMPKIEKAKQVRASMALEAEKIASETPSQRDEVRLINLHPFLWTSFGVSLLSMEWTPHQESEILFLKAFFSNFRPWEVQKWMMNLGIPFPLSLKMMMHLLQAWSLLEKVTYSFILHCVFDWGSLGDSVRCKRENKIQLITSCIWTYPGSSIILFLWRIWRRISQT